MQTPYWIWLAESLGPVSLLPQALVRYFGSPEAVFHATPKELAASGLLLEQQVEELKLASLRRADQILERCAKNDITVLTPDDAAYPEKLKTVYAPPAALYVIGSWPTFEARLSVAVVGTRRPTEGGLRMAKHFSAELAEVGAIIVSGMAIGIDAAAHWGALQAGGTTVGVLCCGVDVDYPVENTDLKLEILRQGGALCSELPPGTPTTAQTKLYIPQRNRLMTGLGDCLLVGETPLKSGVQHTVRHALEQGKEVFCFPPRDLYDPHFEGTLQFLQEGATPVYHVRDVAGPYLNDYAQTLQEAKILGKTPMTVSMEEDAPFSTTTKPDLERKTPEMEEFETLSPLHQQIVRLLFEDSMQLDDLAVAVDLSVFQLLCEMTELEIQGWIEALPGNRYRRIRAVRTQL